jgi:hypothetical protein
LDEFSGRGYIARLRLFLAYSALETVETAAFNVKPSPSEPNNSAALLHLKASRYARRTAGEAPALKPKLADYVALKLKPSMEERPARREPNAV